MLTIPNKTDSASTQRRTTSRSALLAAVADPSNWHKPDAWRPALRHAIRASALPVNVRQWAMWMTDRLVERRGCVTVGEIVSLSCYCRRTTYDYLSQIERAGLVKRDSTCRRTGRNEYRRVAYIRPADVFTETPTLTCESASARTTKGKPLHSPVGDQPKDRRRETGSEQIDERDRAAVDGGWPRLARARSDVPLLRPGYSVNTFDPAERERLMLPPIAALLAPRPKLDDEGPF